MPKSIVTRKKSGRSSKRATGNGSSKDPVGQYASDAWSLAKRTAVGLNEIRKFINIETKILDQSLTSNSISYNGTISSLSAMAQGIDYSGRIGDSIRIQHLTVRGRVFLGPPATNSLMRILIFRDLDGYGSTPTVTNVLQVAGSARAPLAHTTYLNQDRFSILYDELLTVSTTSNSEVFHFDSAHQGHVKYLGSTSASSSEGKGSIYLLAISDEGTNWPTIAFESRLQFTDD